MSYTVLVGKPEGRRDAGGIGLIDAEIDDNMVKELRIASALKKLAAQLAKQCGGVAIKFQNISFNLIYDMSPATAATITKPKEKKRGKRKRPARRAGDSG